MASFNFDRVPNHYAGPIIQRVKDYRQECGRRSLAPTSLALGDLELLIPRHFGFCFGVERAIHMAFSALERNPGKRISLVGEIIHNPLVNDDLRARGMRFVNGTAGARQIPAQEIGPDDVVLIPAFGTTLEIEESLQRRGVDTTRAEFREQFDTTCPFVSKVWDRGEALGREGYTIIIHGKIRHEETRATQSHARRYGKTLVVLDREEAMVVRNYIVGECTLADFTGRFASQCSGGFDPTRDLERVAVVNQTTMLADETVAVTELMREAMATRYGDEHLDEHFADSNDTLCYATNWNQNATKALLATEPDLALVVGGYNSSNTAHLVEICSTSIPSYLISDSGELLSPERIRHFDLVTRERVETADWLPSARPLRLAVSSGASCPDVLMNEVVERVATFCGYEAEDIEAAVEQLSVCEPAAVT